MAGLLGALAYGLVAQGSLAAALSLATFANGPTLGPFATALTASAIVTVLVSLLSRRDADMATLGRVTTLDRRDVTTARAERVEQPSEVTA